MKSRTIIAILLVLSSIFSLFSCTEQNFHNSHDPHDDYNNNQGVNQTPAGDTDAEKPDGAEGKVTYVYSVISKTMHLPDCYHTERMNEDYKFEYTGDLSVMLEKGYTICKDCLVPDEEKEDDEDKEDEILIPKEEATFATNKKSFVVHLLDCYMLDAMIEENLRYTDLTYEALMELKYRPCGTCMPEEYKEYKKNHPEEFEK